MSFNEGDLEKMESVNMCVFCTSTWVVLGPRTTLANFR